MRARYYDAGIGRFISEDPAQDGCNWYAYCYDSPTNRVDCDGRESESFSSYALAAVLWTWFPLPFVENPFLRPALEAFVGMKVNQRWVDELAELHCGYHQQDGVATLGWVTMFMSKSFQLASGVVTVVNAYVLMIEIALVGVDMAMEEGR